MTRGLFLVPLLAGLSVPAAAATYYASPTGGGDGRSRATPIRIADFWPAARPGDTLLLLDGKYTGPDSMIDPPRGLRGEPGRPITVKALNDGKVQIDGEGKHIPAQLYFNDHFVLEGFNAHYGSPQVVGIACSNHNWDV
jgi:hypothetical protein